MFPKPRPSPPPWKIIMSTPRAFCVDMYVLDPRSRGATQILHLEPRTLPAQGKRALPYLSSPPRKDEQRTAPEWPRLPLKRESRATNEHATPPQSPFSLLFPSLQ